MSSEAAPVMRIHQLRSALVTEVTARYRRVAAGRGALLTLIAALGRARVISLVAWTKPIIPTTQLPWLIGVFFLGWLAQRRVSAAHRPWVLLLVSVAMAAMVSWAFLVLAGTWVVLYHRVLYAGIARAWKLGFVIATFSALVILCDVPLALRFHAAHPSVVLWGYLFAVSFTFRIARVFHQAELEDYATPPLRDFLLYFLFAPFFVMVPYMFAIPRFDQFRRGLARLDPDVERAGMRTLLGGIALAVAMYLVTTYGWSPRLAFEEALRQRKLVVAVFAGLAYYPGEVVAIAVSGSSMLIGLVGLLGIELPPSFDRPLAARSIVEWWQRWNLHFRDLLVDLFWVPVALRLRRRPYASIWVGCASVFLLGSPLFHWLAKHIFHHGTPRLLPVSLLCESAAMTVIVGAAMSHQLWRQRRGRVARPRGLAHLAARHLTTYAIVFAAVVCVGYGATYAVELRPFEQLQPRWTQARRLAALGDLDGAGALLAEHVPAMAELCEQEPLDPLRQSQLAFALALPTPARDLEAATDHLAIARTYSNPLLPGQLWWLAAAQPLIPQEIP
jgi:D-alanyl-lipoteichoic acid acyltransferase DltB (MBOAT superfamily)